MHQLTDNRQLHEEYYTHNFRLGLVNYFEVYAGDCIIKLLTAVTNDMPKKLECLSLSVASTLVQYLRARLPAYPSVAPYKTPFIG